MRKLISVISLAIAGAVVASAPAPVLGFSESGGRRHAEVAPPVDGAQVALLWLPGSDRETAPRSGRTDDRCHRSAYAYAFSYVAASAGR